MWFIQKIKSSLIITNINIYVRDAPSLTVFNDGRISSEGMIKNPFLTVVGLHLIIIMEKRHAQMYQLKTDLFD